MKIIIPFLSLSSALLMVACSNPQNCDPNNTDFFSGMGCSVGSGYNHRTQNLQGQLNYEQQNAMAQQQNAAQAHSQTIQLQSELDARRNQLTKIDNQAWAVRKKLQEARANHTMTQQQIKNKEKQLDTYNAKRSKVSTNPSQQDLNALSSILSKM